MLPSAPPLQGLVTGLALAPNGGTGQGDPQDQAQELRQLTDWVRYSLAGNLRWGAGGQAELKPLLYQKLYSILCQCDHPDEHSAVDIVHTYLPQGGL